MSPMPFIDDVTDDAFLGGALRVAQPARGYRAGMDAVLAAAAVQVDASVKTIDVLDVGAGVGVLGLCLARRCPQANVTLVEIDPAIAELARQNIIRNDLQSRMRVVVADVMSGGAALDPQRGTRELAPGTFQHVVSNPPYAFDGEGTSSPDTRKARAHAMPQTGLDAWIRFMTAACASDGTITLIHRTEALPGLLSALDSRFGAIEILPLHARSGEPARRVIVRGSKGSRAPLRLLSGRIMHTQGQEFHPDIEAVLRMGAPLLL